MNHMSVSFLSFAKDSLRSDLSCTSHAEWQNNLPISRR